MVLKTNWVAVPKTAHAHSGTRYRGWLWLASHCFGKSNGLDWRHRPKNHRGGHVRHPRPVSSDLAGQLQGWNYNTIADTNPNTIP